MKKTAHKIAEIAEYLGVSRPTVSYVLNDKWEKRGISKATADRILEYIKEIGFLPNQASLALQGRSIKDVAILIPPNSLEHQKRAFFTLLNMIEKKGRKYMMLPLSEAQLPETAQFIKMYNIPRVIAITTPITWNFHSAWEKIFRNMTDVDCFFYDFPFDKMKADALLFSPKSVAVGIDRFKEKQKTLNHIFSQGYKNIILQESFFDELLTPDFLGRYPADIKLDFYKLSMSDSLFEMGLDIGKKLFELVKNKNRPSAVYINDDLISAAVMKYFKEKGLSVPEDLAILSWDGLPESDYFLAPLTTCVIPHDKMLKAAMDWLEDKPFKTKQIIFNVEIREGRTLPSLK